MLGHFSNHHLLLISNTSYMYLCIPTPVEIYHLISVCTYSMHGEEGYETMPLNSIFIIVQGDLYHRTKCAFKTLPCALQVRTKRDVGYIRFVVFVYVSVHTCSYSICLCMKYSGSYIQGLLVNMCVDHSRLVYITPH